MYFSEIIKQQSFYKAVKYKAMYRVFLQIEAWKMHGYPKFSFWIPRALAKFCFLRIIFNSAKISL